MLREADGRLTTEADRHVFGLFPRAAWRSWLEAEGFNVSSRIDPWNRDVFIARKPA
jgi:hypothetical protein